MKWLEHISYLVRWNSPVYINTLNVLRPFKTIFIFLIKSSYVELPRFKFRYGKYNEHKCPLYTYHYYDGEFTNKNWLFHCIIDDVMWKTKYGIIEYERPPVWYIVMFKRYFMLTLEYEDNYLEYEKMLNKIL